MSGALRDLRRLWGERKQSAVGEEGSGAESDLEAPRPSLPLLQVWPSQDSPKAAEGQAFLFPSLSEDTAPHCDSGIESVQASPCGAGAQGCSGSGTSGHHGVPSPSFLLHPDHARTLRRSSEQSVDDGEYQATPSSSTASSLTSVRQIDWDRRRRSSTMTARYARYSLLDALDLEYALFRAAARGSVGPISLTGSIHKLTFTQSLAFPALARGLQSKRRRSPAGSTRLDTGESGLNAFAKIVTALVLMLVSVLVFGVVYKFVRT